MWCSTDRDKISWLQMETEGDYMRLLGCDRSEIRLDLQTPVLYQSWPIPLTWTGSVKGREYQSNVSRTRQEAEGRPTCWGFKKSEIFWPPLINCHKLGDLTVMQLSHENVWAPLEFRLQVWKIVLFRGRWGGAKSCIGGETTLHWMLWIILHHIFYSIDLIFDTRNIYDTCNS